MSRRRGSIHIRVDEKFIESFKIYLKGERTLAEFVREAIEEKIEREGGKLNVGNPLREYKK